MKNKTLTVLIVIGCMLIAMLPSLHVSAGVNLGDNLLVNGDFSLGDVCYEDEYTTKSIPGWSVQNQKDTLCIREDDINGRYCETTVNGSYRNIVQDVALEAGVTYVLEGDFCDAEAGAVRYARIDANNNGLKLNFDEGAVWDGKTWNHLRQTFVLADGCSSLGFYTATVNNGNNTEPHQLKMKNLKVQKLTEPSPDPEPYISGCDTIVANGDTYIYTLENGSADSWKFTKEANFPDDKVDLTMDLVNGTLSAELKEGAVNEDIQNYKITVEALNSNQTIASKTIKFALADDLTSKFNLVKETQTAWDSHFGTEIIDFSEGTITVSNRTSLACTADQVVTVQRGVTYLVSAEIEADEAADGNQFILTNTRLDAEDELGDLGVTPVTGKQGDTALKGEFIVPGSGEYQILLGIEEIGSVPTETVKIKNVKLYPAPAITSVSFIHTVFSLANSDMTFDLSGCVKIVDAAGTEQSVEEVVWSFDGTPPAGVSISGNLLYVSADVPAGDIGMKAVINANGIQLTGSGIITLEAYIDDDQKLAEAVEALNIFLLTNENPDVITKNLTLPSTVGRHGAVVEWTSTDSNVISDDGVVTAKDTEMPVSMTATIIVNDKRATKTFQFTVAAISELIHNADYEEMGGEDGQWQWFTAPAEYTKKTDGEMGWDYYEIKGRPSQASRILYNYTPKSSGTYILKGYIRSDEDTSALNLMWMYKNTSDMDDQLHDAVPAKSTAGQWTEIVTSVTLTEGIPIRIGFIEAYTQNEATVKDVDLGPISMMPVSAPAAVNINGYASLRVPLEHELLVPFSATVVNASGEDMNESTVTWSLYTEDGRKTTSEEPVYIDSEGELHLKPEAEAGSAYKLFSKAVNGNYSTSSDAYDITIANYLDENALLDDFIANHLQFHHLTEYDKLEQDFDWDTESTVKNNMTMLPLIYRGKVGEEGYTIHIQWQSSNSDVVNIVDNGDDTATAVVTPPIAHDTDVTLTATLVSGFAKKLQRIALRVPKYDNYVKNGGFEYSQQAAVWPDVTLAAGEGVNHKTSLNADKASTAGYAAEFTQEIDRLQAGKYYYLDAALKGMGKASVEFAGVKKEVSINTGGWAHVATWVAFDGKTGTALKISGDSGALYADDILIRDITDELNRANAAVNAAVSSKTSAAKNEALIAVEALGAVTSTTYFDKYLELYDKINKVTVVEKEPGGSNGGGGNFIREITVVDGDEPTNSDVTQNDGFTDIHSHWAQNDIIFLKELGIINGYADGSFQPDLTVSRAEFAAMVARAAGWDSEEYRNEYSDVANHDWYASDVAVMRSRGVMTGSDGAFRPGDMITREEAAVTIVRACSAVGGFDTVQNGEKVFEDDNEISNWAVESVKAAYMAGLVKGVDDMRFAPKTEMTRAETAAIIRRMYEMWHNN